MWNPIFIDSKDEVANIINEIETTGMWDGKFFKFNGNIVVTSILNGEHYRIGLLGNSLPTSITVSKDQYDKINELLIRYEKLD